MKLGERFEILLGDSELEVTYVGNHRELGVDLAKFAHEVRDAQGKGYIVNNYVPVLRLRADDRKISRNHVLFTSLVAEGMSIYNEQKHFLDDVTSRRVAA